MGHFTIGGVAGWLLLSFFYGKLLPALSVPSFAAILVGGVIGVVLGAIVAPDS